MTSPASPVELPQLPKPVTFYDPRSNPQWNEAGNGLSRMSQLPTVGFTTQQINEYGQQCYEAGVRAERERCAQACDSEAKRMKAQIADDVWCGHADTGAMVCADLIRKGE